MNLKTPRELGYRMPAEWEPHEATWIAWPHNHSDWPGKFEAIPWVYAEIVRHLSRVEVVNIIVASRNERSKAQRVLKSSNVDFERIKFHVWPTDRVWLRDSGPIFVRRETSKDSLATTNWRFNAWAKYPDWKHDARLPELIAGYIGVEQFVPVRSDQMRVVLEGGSIDVNGKGLLLTTEECLLSKIQQRNPGCSRRQLEKIFFDYLGIDQVIWLGRGIAGDDTHGHVDDIARFVSSNTVVAVTESNRRDVTYRPLRDNLRRLRNSNNKLKIVELPMPQPIFFRGRRLPASYANFYIANGLVLVPTFNDGNDRVALDILARLFPQREVVGIYCGDFIWGLGAIHCMTQQQPAY
ncbi:MAG TPA: agmatine deiminase family protein [Candidatus Angelobacter sp.]|jgi:agmatine deiminase|nr:agmatine deiminase family protein [Candidatus Angelobacter sp.]